MMIKFNDRLMFMGTNGLLMDEQSSVLNFYLPQQTTPTKSEIAID